MLTLVDPTDTDGAAPDRVQGRGAAPRRSSWTSARPRPRTISSASSIAASRRGRRRLPPVADLRLNYSALTIELAKRARLPVQAHRKEWVEQGALFSYGIDLAADRASRGALRRQHPRGARRRPTCPSRKCRRSSSRSTSRPQRGSDQGAAGHDHPSRRGLPVGAASRRHQVEAPARPHRRLIWKYTTVVVALVAAAIVSVGLTELYFSYQDSKRALSRVEQDKASAAAASIEQPMQDVATARGGRPADGRAGNGRSRRAQSGLPPPPGTRDGSSAS